jgi:16S rRNA (guanine1207-N2)-methyltransferase
MKSPLLPDRASLSFSKWARGKAVARIRLNSVSQCPGGNLLDLGCGLGPDSPQPRIRVTSRYLLAVDVNERALDLVRRNADVMRLTNVNAVLAQDAPAALEFMTIWSNPPIRVGKAELHSLLQTWMPRLTVGSDAWLVVARNLGADSLQRWMDAEFGD